MYMYMYMYMNRHAKRARTQGAPDLYESRLDIGKEDVVSGRSINLALSHRGREALRAVGLEDEVLAKAIPMRARKIHTAKGKLYSIPYSTRPDSAVDRRALNELERTINSRPP